MGTLRKIVAVLLALNVLALFIHFIGGEIYGIFLVEPGIIWDYINGFTAVGVAVVLFYRIQLKRARDRQHADDDVEFSYLATNFMLFAAMVLALWFYANWFEELNLQPDSSAEVVNFIWLLFNAGYVALGGVTAWQLWVQQPRAADPDSGAGLAAGGPQSMQPNLAGEGQGERESLA